MRVSLVCILAPQFCTHSFDMAHSFQIGEHPGDSISEKCKMRLQILNFKPRSLKRINFRGGSQEDGGQESQEDEAEVPEDDLLNKAAGARKRETRPLEDVIADLEKRNQGHGLGILEMLTEEYNISTSSDIYKRHAEMFEDCNPLRFVDPDPQRQDELRKMLHEEIHARGVGGVDESEEEIEDLEERRMMGEFDPPPAADPAARPASPAMEVQPIPAPSAPRPH